jgi:hypothetical protein
VPVLEAGNYRQPEDMFVDGFIHLSPGHRVIAAAMGVSRRTRFGAGRLVSGRRVGRGGCDW